MFFAVIGLLCGCGGDENEGNPNRWESVSLVGQWKLTKIERFYAISGILVDELYLPDDEQDFVIFNEAGFYRYVDCPKRAIYDGTYTYDRDTQRLEMEISNHPIFVFASYLHKQMRLIHETDAKGICKTEYYVRSDEPQLPTPPNKEEDMAVYFPDENFRDYMITHFDTDGNGFISIAEAAQIEKIIYQQTSTASLEGIEYCTSLKELKCDGNHLTTLDISHNTALTHLECYNNQLTTLDVSNCKNLQYLSLYPMPSLRTLYMATGQKIIETIIPSITQIIYK